MTWKERLALFFVLAAALWMYRGASRSSFIQDDFGWLVLSRFQSIAEWASCFSRFNAAGTYRPLSQETYFWAGQWIFGLWAPGYHIFSIGSASHGGLARVPAGAHFLRPFGRLDRRIFYAVHGAHVTSLYWISAFPEPLAVVFLLTSVLLFIRFDRMNSGCAYALSLVAIIFGIFAKESIFSLPLILAAYCLVWARSRISWTLPYFALAGASLLARQLQQHALGAL